MKGQAETFRILAQRPYDEVYKEVWKEIKRSNKILDNEKKMAKFLSKYGWTLDEFSDRMVNDFKTIL
jgi:hypothetical protein